MGFNLSVDKYSYAPAAYLLRSKVQEMNAEEINEKIYLLISKTKEYFLITWACNLIRSHKLSRVRPGLLLGWRTSRKTHRAGESDVGNSVGGALP